MKSLVHTFFMVVVFLPLASAAQDPDDVDPERLVDELFPAQNTDANYEDLYENILQTLSNRLDLNLAKGEELKALFILSDRQIEQFLAYRAANGPLLSLYELQSVPEFDLLTIHKLKAFAEVKDASATINYSVIQRILHEKNNYLMTRFDRTIQKKKGYRSETDSAQRYAGSPNKLYLRFQVSKPGDFSMGITSEKDPGERIAWDPSAKQYGMDYYSMHAQLKNKRHVKNLILGDYQAQFGQGLVLGGGFGMGKSAETITAIRRSTLGFLPYGSLNESGFFRGIASTLSLSSQFSLHTFASVLSRDGAVQGDTSENTLVSSFAVSGYHRTPSEIASRKEISEHNFGTVIEYTSTSLNAGMLFHQTNYSVPIVHKPTLYNQFVFNGNQSINSSAFINYTHSNISFFSEAAQTIHHGAAIIAGVLASLSPSLDLSMLYRNFNRDFHTAYGNAVSESTAPQNEQGMYWGIKYSYRKRYVLSGYLDLFHFPWLRYRAYAPGNGSEWLLKFAYQPSKTVTFFLQGREESRTRNVPFPDHVYRPSAGVKRNYWINCDYAAHSKLRFKTRVQFSTYRLDGHTTRGWVVLQDVTLDLRRFSFTGRYALFEAEDYDNRQYVYERDVLLAFSFPAYYGTGIRQYLVVRFKAGKHLDLWARIAQTRYLGDGPIGSSGETIVGNVQNDIKLQARIRF